MTKESFFEKIGLSEGGVSVYFETAPLDTEYFTKLLLCDRSKFFQAVRSVQGYRQKALRLYLDIAFNNKPVFDQKDISDDIYYDTYSDLSLWCQNCFDSFSEYGIEELEWLAKSIDLRLFRLGRLQFEIICAHKKIKAAGKIINKGDVLLNVHIPQGKPLILSECMDSVERAKSFFKGAQGGFICDSWLLYPDLKKVLPPDSNIIKFQNLFELIRTDYESKQAEERVFKTVQTDFNLYPQKTSLQAGLKRYLLNGGKLGTSVGIMKI